MSDQSSAISHQASLAQRADQPSAISHQSSSLDPYDNEVLVRVQGVSKRFCRDLKRSLFYGAWDIWNDLRGHSLDEGELRKQEFWTNQDISFELRRGECLGLIGRNGAGKTTLLKMLNGLIKPDRGTIEIKGRVGALIALGAGFNPILTGRENVYIAGSVYGLSKKEIDAKYDEIVEFAELEEFMETPVRNYSSGMQVRLGFAVATSMEPDVLLIDEVLAVGDVGFRTKCYNQIHQVCKSAAVIFVSHNMPQIDRLCSRTLVLSDGLSVFDGPSGRGIDHYNQLFQHEASEWEVDKSLEILDWSVNGESKPARVNFNGGETLSIVLELDSIAESSNIELSVNVKQPSGDDILQCNSLRQGEAFRLHKGRQKVRIDIPKLKLGSGQKLLAFRMIDAETNKILIWSSDFCELVVNNKVFQPTPVYQTGYFSFISK